jgi:polyhydroxybutyrate depolymerase
MFSKIKLTLLSFIALNLLLASFSSPAQSQSFRERIKAKVQERIQDKKIHSPSSSYTTKANEIFLNVNGTKRSYLVHAPSNLNSVTVGAVLVFHGGGGDAQRMFGTSNMHRISNEEGFISAYVQTSQKGERWQDGRDDTYNGTEDIEYIRAVIQSLHENYAVDPDRVFATGISNGGTFINRLACETAGLVQGIAPIAANMSIHLNSKCLPTKGMPMIMFSGTDDPLMPFNGGKGNPPAIIKRAMEKKNLRPEGSEGMLSSHDTAKFWASKNGCTRTKTTDLPDQIDDGTTVTVISYDDCREGQVLLYQINGGGHSWPGPDTKELKIIGTTSREIDASAVMVEFFKTYGL